MQGLARLRRQDHTQPGYRRRRPAWWAGRRDDGQTDCRYVPSPAPGSRPQSREERRPGLAVPRGPTRHIGAEEGADGFGKPLQDVVWDLEADLRRVLGFDE